jgi:selenocysteine lyase/cysteine desulfurase
MRAADWVETDTYRLRPDAKRFEEWEQNYAAKAGLAAAIDYARGWGIDAIWERVRELAETMRERLAKLDGVTVRDVGRTRCGIVTFTVDGVGAAEIKEKLASAGINVTVSEPSSTLLDARARQLPDLVRASVHYFNTDDELDRLVESVRIAARC